MYVFICGGHHDRIAVLVMVSKAESIVFSKSYYITGMYNCLNKDFIHSFCVFVTERIVLS